MAAETLKFKIDGVAYEMPEIDDLDIEEWEIVYAASGLVLADFAPALDSKGKLDKKADDARQHRIQQPAFLRARLHIAYRRANPGATDEEINEVVMAAKMVPAMEAIADAAGVGDDEDPPVPSALTPEPGGSSPTTNDESSGSTPTDSDSSSETQDGDPATTTTSGSGTSSPASRQKTSVA